MSPTTCRSQLFLKRCFSSSTGPKKFAYKFPELLKKYFTKIPTAKLVVISPKGGGKWALMSIFGYVPKCPGSYNKPKKNSGPIFSQKVRTLKICNFFLRDPNDFGFFFISRQIGWSCRENWNPDQKMCFALSGSDIINLKYKFIDVLVRTYSRTSRARL